MKRFLLHIIMLAIATVAFADKVGTWKLYPSYSNITEVQYTKADSSEVFVLANGNLFAYYNSDHTFSEFMIEGAQSATGTSYDVLTDRDISHIAWCATVKKLLIVYSDGMIDLLDTKDRNNPTVTSIVGLKETTLFNDKTVDSIRVGGQYAYLTTASHILNIDVEDEYVVRTYNSIDQSMVEGMTDATLMEPVNLDYKYGVQTVPEGPNTNYWWRLTIDNGKVYCADGQYDVETAGSNLRPGNVKIWDGTSWSALPQNIITDKCSYYNTASQVITAPNDKNHLFVAAFSGLYEFNNNQFVKYYDKDDYLGNSPEPNNLLLTGLFDSTGCFWVAGYYSDCLAVLDKNGTWSKSSHPSELSGLTNVAVQSMLEDSRGLIWFCSTRWEDSRVFCYNPKTNVLARYDKFVNQDGTVYEPWLRALQEDNNGNIWIATKEGPFYLSAEDISSDNIVVTQHKINREDGSGLADYLLSGIDVQSISIDKANIKWIATSGNGVYAISDDCNTQLNHFTTENSPLPSNIITDIKIDSATGTVYMATSNGLCSYQSDVTENYGDLNADNIYAYPNPVTPEYTGNITIMGLINGCTVKIVNALGQLVHAGKCSGGSYTWNGCDGTGNRVGSGVYMVLASNAEGDDGCVTKIAVIK